MKANDKLTNQEFYVTKKDFLAKRNEVNKKYLNSKNDRETTSNVIDFSLNPSKYKFLEIVPTIIKDKYYLLGEEYKKKGIPYSPFLQYTPDDLIIEDKRKIDDYFDYYKRHILLENYDEIPETTEEILELMEKSKENSKILGYTKWFEKEGEQKWRECEIETYDKHEKLFTIKIFIQKNNSYLNKKVTRFNILFKGEDLAKLDFRVKLAKKWIYFAKKYMALFHFVDNFKVSNFPQLNMEEFMDKIFHLVYFYRGVNLKQLNPLEVVNLENSMRFGIWRRNARKREIKLDKMKIRKMLNSKKIDAAKIEEIFNDINFYYSRSFQIIEFYKRLPFNYDYFLLLKEIIPKERFLMPSERFLYPSESIGTIQTKRALPFLEVYRIMEKKLHQSDKDTSSLLIDQKMQFLVIGDMCFFYSNWYVKPIDIEFYKKKNEENIEGVYKEIKFMIGNTNHQITTFIKKRLEEAKKINKGATIPIAVINKFRCFQELSNEMIKNLTRSILEKSLDHIYNSFNDHNRILENILKKTNFEEINLDDILSIRDDFNFEELIKNDKIRKDNNYYFQFVTTLKYDRDKQEFSYETTTANWINVIDDLIKKNILEHINQMNTINVYDLSTTKEQLQFFSNIDKKIQVYEENEYFKQLIDKVFEEAKKFFSVSEKFLQILNNPIKADLMELLNFKKDIKSKNYDEEALNIGVFRHFINLNKSYIDFFNNTFKEDKFFLGGLVIQTKKTKEKWIKDLGDIRDLIFTLIIENNNYLSKQMDKEKDLVDKKLEEEPIYVDHYEELIEYCNNLDKKLDGIWKKIKAQQSNVELLEENFYLMKRDEFNKMWSCYGIPKLLHLKKTECLSRLVKDRKRFKIELKAEKDKTLDDISQLKNDYETNILISDLNDFEKDYLKFSALNYRIERMIKFCNTLNKHQIVIGLPITDFSDVKEIEMNFLNYYQLWDAVYKFLTSKVNWMTEPLKKIDRKSLKTTYDYCINTIDRLEKTVFKAERYAPNNIIKQLREKIKEFQPFLPILFDLINPDLKANHINDMAKQIGLPIPDDLNITMNDLIAMNIVDYMDSINDRSIYATGQKKLASKLDKFKEKFKLLKFDITNYKDSNLVVFKDTEILVEEIDNLLTKIVSISTSKYAKYLQRDIQSLWTNLARSQEILDIWLKVQKYMQQQHQIFVYEDIRKQLAMEYSKYESIEKSWKINFEQVKASPFVIEICSINKLKENLIHSLETLEFINKQLNSYLNTKRDAFPRFYFISNEELIVMLALSGDPIIISTNYIQQTFEGIKKLQYSSEKIEIIKKKTLIIESPEEEKTEHILETDHIDIKSLIAMNSEEGEQINLNNHIELFELFNLDGEKIYKTKLLERWLTELEKEMKSTLAKLLIECYKDLKLENNQREEWCCKWQEQSILTISQLDWTQKVSFALSEITKINNDNLEQKMTSNSDENPIKKLYTKEKENLLKLIKKMKHSNISKNLRKTLVSLIIQDVHANDVISYLISNSVYEVNCFEWTSQLRYYLINNKYASESVIQVKMLNTERIYDYEYLGNQKRLVITQLTDRCYRTMMEALYNNLGGAPEGPAGTGKTETIKDLSKNLGKKCFTYNCSEESDYFLMTKFFKGVAMSGCWICFDEFNRISVDVLSVIAYQISTLLNSLRTKSGSVLFEKELINFNIGMAIFITMNPDYAGRSDLPDNLKGLFRPLAMMIPDYAMIAEIMLYSYGFNNARSLSRKVILYIIKIVSSLKLASEQLSTQVHYDYGMRTLNGIINYIGVLNQKEKKNELSVEDNITEIELEKKREEYIVQKAIRDSNMPKFITDDFKIYEGILSDLFPNSNFINSKENNLVDNIMSQIKKQQLFESDYLIEKILDFHNIMCVRHAVMIVGEAMAAKSTLLKLYINSVEEYYNTIDCKIKRSVKYQFINPKSITSSQLYGYVNKTMEFVEGVCSKILREFLSDQSNDIKLLIFDGPVDTIWIENMNSLLDDTKKLCLANSDVIRLDERSFIIFEIDDLSKASLATISRCGMVYNDRNNVKPSYYFISWQKTLPDSYKSSNFIELVNNLYEFLFDPYINSTLFDQYNNFLFKVQVPVFKNWLTTSFIKVLESLLFCNMRKEDIIENEKEKQKMLKRLTESNISSGIEKKKEKERAKYLSKIEKIDLFNKFIYSLFISLSSILEESQAQKYFSSQFNEICKDLMNNPNYLFKEELLNLNKFFVGKDMLDYKYIITKDNTSGQWISFSELLSTTREVSFGKLKSNKNVIIPTIETIKSSELIKICQYNFNSLLMIGPTATGKTMLMKNYLIEENTYLTENNWINFSVILNSKTTANNLCDMIEEKISFKLKKNTVAPQGNKFCLLFVDDVGLPTKEEYGAQPPIEILRQLLDYGGWYDRKEKEFLYLKNILVFSSMTTGRPLISSRLLWHFIPLFLNAMDDVTLKEVYSLYYSAKFSDSSPTIRKLQFIIVDSLVFIYRKILTTFRPLPITPHYCFNTRDLNKMFEGFILVNNSIISKAGNVSNYLIELMLHEVYRCCYDRLIDDSDRIRFNTNIIPDIEKIFKKDPSLSAINLSKSTEILFSSINDEQNYMKVSDIELLKTKLRNVIGDYNTGRKSKDQLDLILFDYSLKHLIRIDRILNRSAEHGLLVGLSGSGRQSLATLAGFTHKFKIFKVRGREEIEEYGRKEWMEDIRNLYVQGGLRREPTIFIVRDTNLKEESYYVDLNCMISSGIIYNLFSGEEKIEVINQIKNNKENEDMVSNDDQQIWDAFISSTMNRLRVFICMNPLDQDFTKRLRLFPALINNTTIDWYESWPENALFFLAKREFSKLEDNQSFTKNIEPLNNVISKGFINLIQATEIYYKSTRRKVIILPKAFLDYVNYFKTFYLNYYNNLVDKIKKYKDGVSKIEEAHIEIKKMKELLELKKPILSEKSKLIEITIKDIDIKSKEANEFKMVCDENQKIAFEKRQDAEIKMKFAEESRLEAERIKTEINQKILSIDQKQFMAMRSYRQPPKEIIKMMQGINIIMSNFEKKPLDSIPTTWDYYKKKLNDVKLMQHLQTLPKKLESCLLSAKVLEFIEKFITDPDLEPSYMEKKISSACACFCVYLKNMVVLDDTLKNKLYPSKEIADKANKELKDCEENLEIQKKNAKEVKDKLDELQRIFNEKNMENQSLIYEITESQKKLQRAERLTSKLSGEKKRWNEISEEYEKNMEFVFGDAIIAVFYLQFLGPYTSAFREDFIKNELFPILDDNNIICSKKFSISKIIGDQIKIQDWIINGLPSDWASIDNGLILFENLRPALMMDPQKQALKFLTRLYKSDILIYKRGDENQNIKFIENAITTGKVIIFDNINYDVFPEIENLFTQEVTIINNKRVIKLNENMELLVHPNFKYFLISYHNNPVFQSELYGKVSIINFTVTKTGLTEQLLSVIYREESPNEELEKISIMQRQSAFKETLKNCEEEILSLLNVSSETLLDNDSLINKLEESKKLSEEATSQINLGNITEERIDNLRIGYVPLAELATLIFFTIQELALIEHIYQFSIFWYIQNIVILSIKQAGSTFKGNIEKRLEILKKFLLNTTYLSVSRSLLNKDKIIFSFMILIKSLIKREELFDEEMKFLFTEQVIEKIIDFELERCPSFIEQIKWEKLVKLNSLTSYKNILDHINENQTEWNDFISNPIDTNLPGIYNELNLPRKLLILKIFHLENLQTYIKKCISSILNEELSNIYLYTIQELYDISTYMTPLILIVMPGIDPNLEVQKIADDTEKELNIVSLGQGQSQKAINIIDNCQKKGNWVFLQNCHLVPDFMKNLEQIINNLQSMDKESSVNTHFRLWMSCLPSNTISSSVLMNSLKITLESPLGIKANMTKLIKSQSKLWSYETDQMKKIGKDYEYSKFLFSLMHFHSIIIERKSYGPLGWNVKYNFNENDFIISKNILKNGLEKFSTIPYKAIIYLTADCIYGGRVTDDLDRRTLLTILNDFYNEDVILHENYLINGMENYNITFQDKVECYFEKITQLPDEDLPQVLGLHPNALIRRKMDENNLILSTFSNFDLSDSSNSSSKAQNLQNIQEIIFNKIIQGFTIEDIKKKFPLVYEDCMNSILVQEAMRYNSLLFLLFKSLDDCVKAYKGLLPLTDEIDEMASNLNINKTPPLWIKVSYPSRKPLASWINDLNERIEFFQKWISKDKPEKFWISGFFFTQSFLTGIKQNFARACKISIDCLEFNFTIIDTDSYDTEAVKNRKAYYIYGLFMEGAKWNSETHCVDELQGKKIYSVMPPILLSVKDINNRESKVEDHNAIYLCPLYKCSTRHGSLSTTGHSTNYIFNVEIPSMKEPKHWIKRGVALLNQLDD